MADAVAEARRNRQFAADAGAAAASRLRNLLERVARGSVVAQGRPCPPSPTRRLIQPGQRLPPTLAGAASSKHCDEVSARAPAGTARVQAASSGERRRTPCQPTKSRLEKATARTRAEMGKPQTETHRRGAPASPVHTSMMLYRPCRVACCIVIYAAFSHSQGRKASAKVWRCGVRCPTAGDGRISR